VSDLASSQPVFYQPDQAAAIYNDSASGLGTPPTWLTPPDTTSTTIVESGLPEPVVNGQWIKGSGGAAIWSAITVADVAGVEAQANKGVANGYASLDSSGKVPTSELPGATVAGWTSFTYLLTNSYTNLLVIPQQQAYMINCVTLGQDYGLGGFIAYFDWHSGSPISNVAGYQYGVDHWFAGQNSTGTYFQLQAHFSDGPWYMVGAYCRIY
jgi:hypothetical protein